MSMLRKVLQLPMQPKYGLLPLGAATCATTIPTFPPHTLRNIMMIIEARSGEIVSKWTAYFGSATYFC